MPRTLQSEIKQSKPFARPSSEAMLSVMRTAAIIEHQIGEALRPYGLTATQYNVLRILRGAGRHGLCGRDVADRLVSKVPDVSRLLDRMEELGLIVRERDEADRRHVTARLSNQGLRLLEKVTPELEAVESARFSRLSPETIQTVIDALAEVRSAR